MKIFTSETSHYSIARAAVMTGIGKDNIVNVKTNDEGRMCTKDLVEKIELCKKEGNHPLMINATLGTTVFGAIDPIKECAEIGRRFGMWVHLDAALGGSMMLASR